MITGGDLRQSRLDVGYKTFTISPWGHRHLHKLAQTLYTLTKISTGYLGQPL